MQKMLNFVETEDVFFDSVSHLVDENPTTNAPFGCELWRSEIRSVKERRDSFLHEMGFVEEFSPLFKVDNVHSLEMGLERMEERVSGAVSSSCCSSSIDCEDSDIGFYGRECNGNANSVVDEWEDDTEPSSPPSTSHGEEEQHRVVKSVSKRLGHWWKEIKSKQSKCKCELEKGEPKKVGISRMKTRVQKKGFKELSALFESQEIPAHEGVIRAMKFSPDGKYLASGGQDGVVKVWHVKSIDSCLESFPDEFGFRREKKAKAQVVLPEKMFRIEEQPLHEFHGHIGEVLDVAWSNANCLLSASTDKTVRLWKIGSEECLNNFNHTDYVTCVQFNPTDEHRFISGSIDGKVRIWGLSKGRVLDWADIGDAVTAVSYQPDGKGFVVGSLGGTCRFYDVKGDLLELSAHMLVHGNRKSSNNRITGIQFSPEDSQKVMVMCEDSKLRIFNKMEVDCKYKGLPKSGSQMSASFTSNARHIISIGEDSQVYVWNHEHPCLLSSKRKKSILSCEHFHVEGVSVALPWSSSTKTRSLKDFTSHSSEHEPTSQTYHTPSFSFSNLFSSKSSTTWPEEMLPVINPFQGDGGATHEPDLPPSWGLVVVTGNCDGIIRTFHNYGLPVGV